MQFHALLPFLIASGLAAADPAIWIEGEAPSVVPQAITGQTGFPAEGASHAAWGRTEIISAGKLLHLNLSAETVEKFLPAEGIAYAYDAVAPAAGKRELWARLGYEWVRAPFRWRLGAGAWQEVAPTVPTTDVMALQDHNEIAWLKLGEVELAAGANRLEFAWPKVLGKDAKTGKEAVQRILAMLDCLVLVQPGGFRPASHWQPGQDHRSDADKAAEAQVFRLPAPAGPGARSEVALTGAWQLANWDEDDAVEAERLQGTKALPDLAALRWFAYQVPGDRQKQHPAFALHHRFIARCRVEVPAECAGLSYLLDVQRFTAIATVFVNGQRAAWSRNHGTGWVAELGPALKPGSNEIAVVIKDRYYSLRLDGPLGWRECWKWPESIVSKNAAHELPIASDASTGLTEPVTLIAAGPAYVAEAFVKTSVARKELAIEAVVANPGAQPRRLELRAAMLPWNGGKGGPAAKTCAPLSVELAPGERRTVAITEPWPDARLWWPDDPQLYWAELILAEGGAPLDASRTRFGFREWDWSTDHSFRLNGVKWQFWADNTHGGDPERFFATAAKSGQNICRVWTNGGVGPLTRRQFLDACDERGMVVRSSGIFDGQVCNYWGGLVEPDPEAKPDAKGKVPRRAKKALFDNWNAQLAAWVRYERNHPGILIWSVENEITFINANNLGMKAEVEPAMREAIAGVMRLDPTRPAMVDGGNALADGSLPINGGHYTEFTGCTWRDYPDACYDRELFYRHAQEHGKWTMVPNRPIFQGEILYANGYTPEEFATFGGERCFIGLTDTWPARGIFGRMVSEGYRWSGVSAWHFWMGGESQAYWPAWQPVAVLCRQWNWTFGGGAQVPRLLKVFNQTRSDAPITAAWELQLDGRRIAGESREFRLPPGEAAEWPVQLAIPAVATRTAGRLLVTASRGGAELFRNQQDLAVLAPDRVARPALAAGELAVLDPQGTVLAHLKRRGVACTPVDTPEGIPAGARVVVVGSDAIAADRSGDPRWFSLALAGRRVIVLDQANPLRYRALPTDAEPTGWTGRIAFPENLAHPIFAGLAAEDFFTWGSDHVVYRNAYRKGARGGRSLLQCDVGLKASALIECQPGDGLLLLSQLAIGGKLAGEAVAQQVFDQMLAYAAAYRPVRRQTLAAVPADGPEAKALAAIGIQHRVVADPLQAIAGDGVAVVAATPAALKALADAGERVQAFCRGGGWLLLWGVTAEGLADYNRIVGFPHRLRPFEAERVLLSVPADPLLAGLTLRDVVMDNGEKMFPWMSLMRPDGDAFTGIVDYTDIAPFCEFPGAKAGDLAAAVAANAGWSRNVVNGFTHADAWKLIHYMQTANPRLAFTLPGEEEVRRFSICLNLHYAKPGTVRLWFDDDPAPVALKVERVTERQDFQLTPRRARKLAIELADFDPTHEVCGIDNIWLEVARPAEFLARARPLLNLGGLMRYDLGKGGIVLNQLKPLEREKNPANIDKKRAILRTLLANLGAVLGGERPLVAGAMLRYEPVAVPASSYNAFVSRSGQPPWFPGPGDLAALPVGEQTYGGVRFMLGDFKTSPVPSAWMLKGEGSKVAAEAVAGIAVGRKADAVFFLHTLHPRQGPLGQWQTEADRRRNRKEPVPEPPACFAYAVEYEDGSTAEIPVRWRQDVGGWLGRDLAPLPNASVAWAQPLAEAKDGEQAIVWCMQWNNPKPQTALRSLGIRSAEGGKYGTPAVFAMTTAVRVE